MNSRTKASARAVAETPGRADEAAGAWGVIGGRRSRGGGRLRLGVHGVDEHVRGNPKSRA